MNTLLNVIIQIIVMLGLVYGLYLLQKKRFSFTVRALTALTVGILYGAVLQLIYGDTSPVVKEANNWFAIIGNGYVRLLKLIVIPLVFVSITSAIINVKNTKNFGKVAGLIIATLVITAGIAAAVGAGSANLFNLDAQSLQAGQSELTAGKSLEENLKSFQAKPIQQQIVEIIPTNPFYALTGQGSSATLSVVFFAALVGIAVLGLKKKNKESAEFFIKLINSLHDVIMRIVTLILRLTPFGVLALMTKFVSTSNFSEITRLLQFVLASYVALIIMFVVHLIIVAFLGLNPITYVKKVAPALAFAFTSRTSAGTIPLTVETQITKLGVPEGHANLAASLGTSIGQNGCAGIYPAMVAVMIAPSLGIDPLSIGFLVKLIVITAISSFGIAGVGGGATFAALTVLSSLGFPVGLVGLLIAIEPIIDMGRTALNVSDSIIAGLVSSKLTKELDAKVYNNKEEVTLSA
jgi:L-cystine uptake protein TcyP (sodium:dicarboxylate symporter family)